MVVAPRSVVQCPTKSRTVPVHLDVGLQSVLVLVLGTRPWTEAGTRGLEVQRTAVSVPGPRDRTPVRSDRTRVCHLVPYHESEASTRLALKRIGRCADVTSMRLVTLVRRLRQALSADYRAKMLKCPIETEWLHFE